MTTTKLLQVMKRVNALITVQDWDAIDQMLLDMDQTNDDIQYAICLLRITCPIHSKLQNIENSITLAKKQFKDQVNVDMVFVGL